MELTIEQALHQGVAAHKEGKLQEAERLYRAILRSQPQHPDANHNMGVLAVGVGKVNEALPLFKTALEANPKIEQFWFSYIDALIREKQFANAKQVLEQARKQGVDGGRLDSFAAQLSPRTDPPNTGGVSPPQDLLDSLLGHYQNGRLGDAEKLAVEITQKFPKHPFAWKVLGTVFGLSKRYSGTIKACKILVALEPADAEAHSNLGITLQELGRLEEAEASHNKAILLEPNLAEAYYNFGITLKALGRLWQAKASYLHAITLKQNYAKAHYNLGIILHELGWLEKAEASYKKALILRPRLSQVFSNMGNVLQGRGRFEEAETSYLKAIILQVDYVEAHVNLGNALQELGRIDEAKESYKGALVLEPSLKKAFWNLSGTAKSIQTSEDWINKYLTLDTEDKKARLTKAALRFYKGDRSTFDNLIQSNLKQHSYMRSFSWIFSLPYLPELHFNKFYFFDAAIKQSIISRPFYEFGVWRGSSFNYLMKFYKKGYGFDTFTGLPENWHVGGHIEKRGSYTSDGKIPRVRGGEFIVGKFEDSLPVFFSRNRPVASLINFDADLYSSTICALNFSKSVIDKSTILIFDEFLMHESWEEDEFKALNEFCFKNEFRYEVIAISFFTKQVAIKLIGV